MNNSPTTLEQLLELAINKRNVSIGLPAPSGTADRRFPLTPEAASILVERGFTVKMQASGANSIHYNDMKYSQLGVNIVDRAEAMRCDVVIYLSAIDSLDARMLKRGGLLLTMLDSATADALALRTLLANGTLTIALDLVEDERGNHPFADILSEIAGRAAVAIASSLLADAVHGKGILLGGVAGVVPCEVTILGAGMDARAAAGSAIGLGAIVKMFDNDVYRLRRALRELGPGVSGSALHPHVLQGALRSADVVIATDLHPRLAITSGVLSDMKQGVVIFDLNASEPTFPSIRRIDLGLESATDDTMEGREVCYINPGNAVPRTAAMALSNALLTMFNEIFSVEGLNSAMMLNNGLQLAALTFMGKAVHPMVSKLTGARHFDIKLLLQFS